MPSVELAENSRNDAESRWTICLSARKLFAPLAGILYGWALFLVIQTGTHATVRGVAFARFLGIFITGISAENYYCRHQLLCHPAMLSVFPRAQQLVAVLLIIFLTFLNMQGLALGKLVQNIFTSAKTLSLIALYVLLGIIIGGASGNFSANMSNLFTPQNAEVINDYLVFSPKFRLVADYLV